MFGKNSFQKRIDSAVSIFKTVCKDLDNISNDIEKAQEIEANKILEAQKAIDNNNKELSKLNKLRTSIHTLLGMEDESTTDIQNNGDNQ